MYVPVGVDQPVARRERILARAGVCHVLTGVSRGERLSGPVVVSPDVSAYVIFTSGSTGEPKGVEVSHRAALNTVVEVNERFGVGAGDRVLAVSALDFDLSVYDIFGLLSVGGALVLPEEGERRDAQAWARLCETHGVTLWNTVPTLLDMLLTTVEQAPSRLRLALVSGDWVGLDLQARLAAQSGGRCRLVALGGATEAAIWSNALVVDRVAAHWTSVPYGFPLRNQRYRVVDGRGRDCPDWVAGEL
ncbi:AMP-binding protein, partial [Nonomuraea deserti]|uniref:AMP-binding protein n=1 Tax=Nonomuraea deserti TaxID=1848322 RepID=UPI0024824D7B